MIVPLSAPTLIAGDRLDRYEVLCLLDEGGMAAVWLANQHGCHGFNKRVALKTILPGLAAEPGFRRLFMDESRVASRIHHENVAQVLDLGEERGILYLVLEWVDGASLRALEIATAQASEEIPHRILLRILSDTCTGVHVAHELRDEKGKALQVVHRDISPQNILVSGEGTTKVIDFGIAKARDRLSNETTPGVVKGKKVYMAPEQALGLPVDRRADIWAIGAIFYRMVTGHSPFEASNAIETMSLLRRGKIAEPLGPGGKVHRAIAAVIDKALSPSPSGRFGTMLELREALGAAMHRAGAEASQREVAAFLERHLGASLTARRERIQHSLFSARERRRYRPEELTPVIPTRVAEPKVTSRDGRITERPGAYRIIEQEPAMETSNVARSHR